ncbi:MAG TPA: hypothetical protein VFE37_24165 [Chloroflexota bacterium]|nr:hypothetical protein [Chloroflexota bacterium]
MATQVDGISSVPQEATGGVPCGCPGRVHDACTPVEAVMPSACLTRTVATHYAEQALLHQRRALAYLDEVDAPRAVPLPLAEQEELLVRAVQEGQIACRLLQHAEQEMRDYPCPFLESRLTKLRAILDPIEQQLTHLVT